VPKRQVSIANSWVAVSGRRWIAQRNGFRSGLCLASSAPPLPGAQLENSRPLRRGPGLTFPTHSGRIAAAGGFWIPSVWVTRCEPGSLFRVGWRASAALRTADPIGHAGNANETAAACGFLAVPRWMGEGNLWHRSS
jgi:hypothetical protein